MSNKVEYRSVTELVQDSNDLKSTPRSFDYTLSDKQTKSKLIKGAQREPFAIEEKSWSINIVFSVGSLAKAVLPTILYMNEFSE